MAADIQFDHFEVTTGEIVRIRFTSPKLTDEGAISQLQSQLLKFVEDKSPKKLVVDLTAVIYCPSLLINCLLKVRKAVMQQSKGRLVLCMTKQLDEATGEGRVFQAFQLLHLDERMFQIFETSDEAVAALR